MRPYALNRWFGCLLETDRNIVTVSVTPSLQSSLQSAGTLQCNDNSAYSTSDSPDAAKPTAANCALFELHHSRLHKCSTSYM
jgi:hypothetical protein